MQDTHPDATDGGGGDGGDGLLGWENRRRCRVSEAGAVTGQKWSGPRGA